MIGLKHSPAAASSSCPPPVASIESREANNESDDDDEDQVERREEEAKREDPKSMNPNSKVASETLPKSPPLTPAIAAAAAAAATNSSNNPKRQRHSVALSGHLELVNKFQRPASPALPVPTVSGSQQTSSLVDVSAFGNRGAPSVQHHQQTIATSPSSCSSSGVSSVRSFAYLSPSSVSPTSSTSSSASSTSASSSRSPTLSNLLDYYPELSHGNGLALSWWHAANNRASLNAALASQKLVISGDISLAEMSRYPVPIMARPPLNVSDLTLDNWLLEVSRVRPQRAIKLTFTSTRTVEPAFRVLAKHAEHLRGPLILAADILSRPALASSLRSKQQTPATGTKQPVDAWTFLMLCRTRFPRSIISIGWCPSEEISLAYPSLDPAAAANDQIFELDILETPSHLSNQQQQQQPQHHPALSQLINAALPQHQRADFAHQRLQHRYSLGSFPTAMLSPHHQLARHQPHSHNHMASSSGSLTSSSGNSSGSPSPTSPVSQLLSPTSHNSNNHHHHHQVLAATLMSAAQQPHLQLGHPNSPSPITPDSSCPQEAHGGGASRKTNSNMAAAAAAAAMTAALVAASQSHAGFQSQQLPLNLNINEASDRSRRMSICESNPSLASKLGHHQPLHTYYATSVGGIQAPQAFTGIQQSNSNSILSKRLLSGGHPSDHVHKKAAVGSSPTRGQVAGGVSPATSSATASKAKQTLKLPSPKQQADCGYTREMIDKMANLVKEYNLTQPVTFPVEAKLVKNSLAELQRLLYQVGANSTLTLVAQPEDLISVDELQLIKKSFAANQLLFDLPDELLASFRQQQQQQHQVDI